MELVDQRHGDTRWNTARMCLAASEETSPDAVAGDAERKGCRSRAVESVTWPRARPTPDHAVRRDNRTVGQHHVVVRDPCHRGAKADLDSVAEQDLRRVPVGLGRERAEDGVAEVDKDDAGLLEREVRSLPCSSRSVSRSSSSCRASSCCTCWTNDPVFLGRALRIAQGWREA